MSPGRALPAGTEIAGYTIAGTLGRGGTAVVYRATHVDRPEPVALKVMEPAALGSEELRLLEHESRLAAAVAHRHILPVYETGEHDRRPFVAMRLERCDLSALLRQEGRLPAARAVRYVAHVASALDAAHAHGLVHRDVKPSNVLLGEADGVERAYVSDFGVARAAFSGGEPFGDGLVGTLGYVSPEQIRGELVDGRTDIYALGCLLYECLVGRVPFRRSSSIGTLWAHLHEEPPAPSMLLPALSPGLDAVIMRALAKDPCARYGSAGALADAAVLTVNGGGAKQKRPAAPGRKTAPRLAATFATDVDAQPAGFLGRESELTEADLLLRSTRFLTVTGPGGAGKTRFALELSSLALETRVADYRDGGIACFFAPLRERSLLLPTIAQALSVSERAGGDVLESLAAHLAGKRLLLLCDNLEHLVGAAGELSELVAACPELTVLCTSREVLHADGEVAYALPPLTHEESVELLCERASTGATTTIRELCARLDGLPLALELAAASLALLAPEELLERLSERLDLLRAGPDADPRQQTLRATIQWSWDLLSGAEQNLLASLSIFAGGCTLEAAEEVAGAELDDLQSLLDKSLLRRSQTEAGPRFWMLETIREFGEGALRESGGAGEVEARHSAFFERLAAEIASPRWGASSTEDRRRFEADRANLTSAVYRSIASHDAATALRLVRSLGDHLHTSTGRRESLRVMQDALTSPGGDQSDRAHALLQAARLAAELGRVDEFRTLSSSAEAILVDLDDTLGLWQLLQERAFYESIAGNHTDAIRDAERAIELARDAGSRELEKSAMGVLGTAILGLQLARNDPAPDELQRARALLEAADSWAQAEGTGLGQWVSAGNFASCLTALGEYEAALETAQRALRGAVREPPSLGDLSLALLMVAWLAALLGVPQASARLAGFSHRHLEPEEVRLPPYEERESVETEALARAAIGDDAYEQGLSEGERLSSSEAIELALSVKSSPETAGSLSALV